MMLKMLFVEVKFDRNLDAHQEVDDDQAELNNGNGFDSLCYEENDLCSRDLFYENNTHAKYKRESEHR